MNSVIIVAGIIFVPETVVSDDLIAYHRGDCTGIEDEAIAMGYRFKVSILEEDIKQYTLKRIITHD